VLIARYAVDVPYYDDWDDDIAVHIAYLQGTLSADDWFHQSNDSRPVVPRLIWLASDLATHSSRRAEMWISFVCVCITSINLHQLGRKTAPQNALLLCAIGNGFLFSIVQYENWFWANQLMLFLPVTLFTSALVVTYSNWRFGWKITCSIVLWILATLCFVSGLFFAPLLLVVQWILAPSRRDRIVAAGAWSIAFAVTLALYFRHRIPVPAPSRPEVFWLYPKDALAFFCCYFAVPFRLTGMTWLQLWTLGALVVVLSLIPLARLRRQSPQLRPILPWAAIVLFALISGAGATSSRLTMGLPQSQVSRYTTTTVLVPIAALYLWTINRQRFSRSARRVVATIGVGLFALHLAASYQRLHDLQQVASLRAAGRDALARINHNDRDPALLEVYPDIGRLKLLANEYSKLGQLPLLETQPPPR
jgi:hypothetical protein